VTSSTWGKPNSLHANIFSSILVEFSEGGGEGPVLLDSLLLLDSLRDEVILPVLLVLQRRLVGDAVVLPCLLFVVDLSVLTDLIVLLDLNFLLLVFFLPDLPPEDFPPEGNKLGRLDGRLDGNSEGDILGRLDGSSVGDVLGV